MPAGAQPVHTSIKDDVLKSAYGAIRNATLVDADYNPLTTIAGLVAALEAQPNHGSRAFNDFKQGQDLRKAYDHGFITNTTIAADNTKAAVLSRLSGQMSTAAAASVVNAADIHFHR